MPLWARIVTVLAAVRVAGAVAIFLSGNSATPPDAPIPLGVYAFLCATFGLVGAMLVTASREDVRASWLGGVLILLAVPLTSALVIVNTRELDLIRLDPFLPAFLFSFASEFPSRLGSRVLGAVRAAGAACAAVAFVLAAINLWAILTPIELGTGDWRERLSIGREAQASFYWLLVLAPSFVALLALAARLFRSSGPDRFRARVFVGGLLAGVLPLVLQVVAEETIPGLRELAHSPAAEPVVAAILFGAFATIPFITAYSVLYDHVVELRVALRTAVQYMLARYVVLLGTLVPIAALAIYLYQRRTEPLVDLFVGFRPVLLAVGGVAGALTLRARRRILWALDRRYFREDYDTGQLIASVLSDELLTRDPASIADGVASAVDSTMHAAAQLFVLDDAGNAFVDPRGERPALAVQSTLATLLLADARPMDVTLSSDTALARLPADERSWLAGQPYVLLVPLRGRDGTLAGLVGFGQKKSGLDFTASERRTIAAFTSPLAMALENERLRRVPPSEGLPAAECVSCSRVHDRETAVCSCGGTLQPAAAPRSLRGVFRLDRRIGSGGMGVVYRGIDLSLKREVAIKTLPRISEEHAARLRHEAQAMASLTHPHLAVIYGLETWRGVPFLVEEYLPGGTLSDRLKSGALGVGEALDVVLALADVLHYVHASGIVHCDIKPSNLGFSQTGAVKVLDFGLAHLLRGNPTFNTTITRGTAARPATSLIVTDRGVMGTPPYMSPEAIHAARPIPAFDLWALAVLLYESLAARRPFEGATAGEVFANIERGRFTPLIECRPDCGAAVSRFIDRALSRDLGARLPDAGQVRAELLRLRPSVH